MIYKPLQTSKIKINISHLFLLIFFCSCIQSTEKSDLVSKLNDDTLVQESTPELGDEVWSRFQVPEGFRRIKVDSNSFGFFLRRLPLKSSESMVKYYNGTTKSNQNTYEAVVDLPIGNKNLHQCADAVMRLRADYLKSINKEDEIAFNFTNGMKVHYHKWKSGDRIIVQGNKTTWIEAAAPENASNNYWNYLEMIFTYAGTASLEKELHLTPITEMKIGDVFIQGGSPGHAVIVIDMARNNQGQSIYMLAQSYMPAQEIHILTNPNYPNISPWYQLSKSNVIKTPEWTFYPDDLRRF